MTELGSPQPFGPGTTAGHHVILSPLGRGGMGEVFLARDTRLDRKVAIKILPEQFGADPARLARFETEAKALAAINHPNIVSVYSIEHVASRHLLVMEFVEGRTLRELIPPGGMTVSTFLGIAVSVADAIGAAHARGLIHRDLKPENIMVTDSGRVKILDFGLAKFDAATPHSSDADTAPGLGLSVAGMALGTVPYMSPEQAEARAVDARSDVFSLGIVFHEMLTGRPPFGGRTAAQVFTAILRDDPPPLHTHRADLPSAFEHVIGRCLRKPMHERYTSGETLCAALRDLRAQPLQVDTPAPASNPAWADEDAAPVGAVLWRILDSRWGLTGVLALAWMFNWIETAAEELWSVRRGDWIGYDFAAAFNWVERGLSFERHDLAGPVAVYVASIAYFFIPVVLFALTLFMLIPRRTVYGYRVFTFAITFCFLLSLPFYVFLPVPERWAFPDSQAILLSDLWSTRLIETLRPISGIDNCFPSFHTSGTVALVLVWYVLRLRLRHAVACLGAAVVLSTIVLGIHWIVDVIAGLALAVIATQLAVRADASVRARTSDPVLSSPAPALQKASDARFAIYPRLSTGSSVSAALGADLGTVAPASTISRRRRSGAS